MMKTKQHIDVIRWTVSRRDFKSLATAKQYEINTKRFAKQLPPQAQPISEHLAYVIDCPKKIVFRMRFSRHEIVRQVRRIIIDISDRFNTVFTIDMKI